MQNSWNSANTNKTHEGLASTLIVEEIADTQGGYAKGPERALMSALLFDGVVACMNYLCFGPSRSSERYKEAFIWVNKHSNEYVFSFDNVCEGLGINPEFLRLGIINAARCRASEWKRARRNF